MEFLVAAGLIAFELGLVVISHVQPEIFDASVLFLAVFTLNVLVAVDVFHVFLEVAVEELCGGKSVSFDNN